MNLREEIEAYHREHFDDTPEWTAKVILKMVEKRIDERIGQLSFFEENLNNDEYKFNVKKHDRELAKAAITNKRLAFLEMKEMLK